MRFMTSCMVLVPDEENQQFELETWAARMGWRVMGAKGGAKHLVADAQQGRCMWVHLEGCTPEAFGREFIDCGENTTLFKALAAMNDENDREQWFVAHTVVRFECTNGIVHTESGECLIMAGEWFKVLTARITDIRVKWMAAVAPELLRHKATTNEIIAHAERRSL